MSYLIIEGGIVVAQSASEIPSLDAIHVEDAPSDAIGMGYDGSSFTAAPEDTKSALAIALMSLVHDFGDGRVIQVRPTDEQNIRTRIELMTRHGLSESDFKMKDNKSHKVNIAELQEALESGQDQASEAWQAHLDSL